MDYNNVLDVINKAIELSILIKKDGCIYVYRDAGTIYNEGWYLDPVDVIIEELMDNPDSITILEEAIEKEMERMNLPPLS